MRLPITENHIEKTMDNSMDLGSICAASLGPASLQHLEKTQNQNSKLQTLNSIQALSLNPKPYNPLNGTLNFGNAPYPDPQKDLKIRSPRTIEEII